MNTIIMDYQHNNEYLFELALWLKENISGPISSTGDFIYGPGWKVRYIAIDMKNESTYSYPCLFIEVEIENDEIATLFSLRWKN